MVCNLEEGRTCPRTGVITRRRAYECVLRSFRFDVDLPRIVAGLAPTNVTVQYSIALLRSSVDKRSPSSGLSMV